jgi:hypothetical protein
MCTGKLKRVVSSARPLFHARLANYRFDFSKVSTDKSGKGNIIPSPRSEVWGVVFQVDESQHNKLTESEGGYSEFSVTVVDTSGKQHAVLTYIANSNRTQDDLLPFDWYKAFVVRGAKQHGLPKDYIRSLEAFDSEQDPDPQRQQAQSATAC